MVPKLHISLSQQVNLGVVHSNPATTPGTIDIMQHMASYIPDEQDITCGGDGMSMERMLNAIFGCLNEDNPWKLGHMKPTPQEFHKEILLMQVTAFCNTCINCGI